MKRLAAILLLVACGTTSYEFDDVDVGDTDGARTPQERSNSQFVRAVYADLVGRTPESYDFIVSADGTEVFRIPVDEQDFLVDILEGMGDSQPLRARLTAGLAASSEVDIPGKDEVDDPEEFIAEQFRRFLGREPTAYELRAFADEWRADDAASPRAIIRALIGSREYQSF